MQKRSVIKILISVLLLSSCSRGPDYVVPNITLPNNFKEMSDQWKLATPLDEIDRGEWWKIFGDEGLNDLIIKLNNANQDIAISYAQYKQALSLVDQSTAPFSPTLGASGYVLKQKPIPSSTNKNATPTVSSTASATVSWEPDLWGNISHTVSANEASAQASAAQLAATKLSMQTSLAQYYFQLCALDLQQKILDVNVEVIKKLLKITTDRFKEGVDSRLNIVTIKSQLDAAEVQAIDNGVLRSQYEHAIAVLVGEPACGFSISPKNVDLVPPSIPVLLPSQLLERRPDIAQAERAMAAANEEIGVAATAFFPTLTLSGSRGVENSSFGKMLSAPYYIWSMGPQLAATIFDGGLLRAKENSAVANYDQAVANYRKVVLAAFQDTEDNLVSLRLLEKEVKTQKEAVGNAKLQLELVTAEYISGIAALSDVITAQINLHTTRINLNTILQRRMVSSVALVKSLGGGWHKASINKLSK